MTHSERLALIYRPFPHNIADGGRRSFGNHMVHVATMTWAGTIVGDRFFGEGEGMARRAGKKPTDGDYEGHYASHPDLDDTSVDVV